MQSGRRLPSRRVCFSSLHDDESRRQVCHRTGGDCYRLFRPSYRVMVCPIEFSVTLRVLTQWWILRAPNIMKHVCVAARIGDGEALDAANVENLRKSSNAASADSGCNP